MRLVVIFQTWVAATAAEIFSLSAYAPRISLHGQEINAANHGFYLGLPGPRTYCPPSIADDTGCPPVLGTFVSDLLMSMAVSVPGGQSIYVSRSGAVSYTAAHRAFVPIDAYVLGWYNKTIVSSCKANITLTDWITPAEPGRDDCRGVLMCPVKSPSMGLGNATYQLFARVPTFNQTGCTSIDGLLEHSSSADWAAWQYM